MDILVLGSQHTPNLAHLALAAIGVLILLPGLAYGQYQTDPDSAFKQEIKRLRSRVVTTMESRDAAGYASLFTTEAVVMPKGSSPITGRDNIREWSEGLFRAFQPNIQISPQGVQRLGEEWALDWGRYQTVYESVNDTDPMEVDETYLWLLRRNDNGNWRLARIIWNSNVSPEDKASE